MQGQTRTGLMTLTPGLSAPHLLGPRSYLLLGSLQKLDLSLTVSIDPTVPGP